MCIRDRIYPFAFKGEKKQIYVSNRFWAQTISNLFEGEVVIGLDDVDGIEEKTYNAACHFLPHQIAGNRYEKRILVPIGEYLPFEWCRTLAAQFGLEYFFTPGVEAKVFQGLHPFAPSICYEETFNGIVREGRKKGASFFVNLTNDGWYPDSRLPREHFAHGRVRAIENGAPLVRACNTGITAYVNSLGEVVAQLDKEVGVLTFPMQIYTYPTLFLLLGNWWIVVFSAIATILFLLKRKSKAI